MGRTYESMMEELEVIEILSTAYDGDEFPGYENIRLSFSQLETIIRNKRSGWLDALRNQKAVYLITDTSNGKMYVGSATAQYGMLLQRWTILPFVRQTDGRSGNQPCFEKADTGQRLTRCGISQLPSRKYNLQAEMERRRYEIGSRRLRTRPNGYGCRCLQPYNRRGQAI